MGMINMLEFHIFSLPGVLQKKIIFLSVINHTDIHLAADCRHNYQIKKLLPFLMAIVMLLHWEIGMPHSLCHIRRNCSPRTFCQ